MCIAIRRPKGKALPKRILLNCWENNPDGAGFMYAENGVLVVDKGFMKWKAFWKAIRPHLFTDDKELVVHFRIATSGKVDYENCHPHMIHDGLAYVHNGIIYDLNDDKDKCDTIRLAEILKALPEGFIQSEGIMSLITMAVGSSKFVFMDNNGQVRIINEDLGIESDDIWYSNVTFRHSRSSSYKGGFESEWRWSPYYQHSSRIVSAEGATAQESLALELPISAGFKDGQTFDPDMPEGMVDDNGLTILEYEDMAIAEASYWMARSESLSPYCYNELCEIIEASNDGEPIRGLVQEWLEIYRPGHHGYATPQPRQLPISIPLAPAISTKPYESNFDRELRELNYLGSNE